MVNSCNENDESKAAYAKLGKPYPEEIDDVLYKEFLKETHTETLPKEIKEKVFLRLMRIKPYSDLEDSPEKDQEFLVYGFNHNRIDKTRNLKTWYRSRVGLWADPIPIWGLRDIDATRKERYLVDILGHKECYSIRWDKSTIEWLKKAKKNGEFHPKIGLGVYRGNNFGLGPKRTFTVQTFADFIEGDFDMLERYGRIIKSDAEKIELEKQIATTEARIAIRGY